jgi:DNA-binding beta-propeller fold protein YncE
MRTGLRRHLRTALAGSLLFGATVVAFVFVGSLPASASPAYAVTKTIAVGMEPWGVAVDPNTGTVYVADYNSGNKGTVSVISEATDTVTKTILGVGGKYGPKAVAVDPNTGTVYVAGNNTVVISEATDTVTNKIPGADSWGVAVDPDTGGLGGTVFVTNLNPESSGTVSVITQAPTVTAVSPNSGPTSGGTAITITGTGFVSGATVVIGQGTGTVGAIAATNVKVVSPTEITAVTGGGSKVNVFNLFVTTPGGTSKANYAGDEFTYQ